MARFSTLLTLVAITSSGLGCARSGARAEKNIDSESTLEASAGASSQQRSEDRGAGEVIGEATMSSDGTLTLTLFRPAPALFRYPKTHPQYGYVLEHVGPIEPGDRRAVRPFPAQDASAPSTP